MSLIVSAGSGQVTTSPAAALDDRPRRDRENQSSETSGLTNASFPGRFRRMIRTIEWIGDEQGFLRLLDQTRLPAETVFVDCRTVKDVWTAIRSLQVRGAPAIGVSAAYGLVLGVAGLAGHPRARFDAEVAAVAAELATSRPTAVNLFWALDRMRAVATRCSTESSTDCLGALFNEARAIEQEDREMCAAM